MKFHAKRKSPVTVAVHKTLVNDPRLNPYDKGLFLFLAANSGLNEFTLTSISKENKCGPQSVKTGIRNLRRCGYLKWVEKDGTFYLNDNPDEVESVKQFSKPVKKVEKKPKMTPEQYKARNNEMRKKFIEETKKAVVSMESKPKYAKGISQEIIARFVNWWTEVDTLKPEKGLRFEECDRFHHARRLATFISRNEEKNQKDRL